MDPFIIQLIAADRCRELHARAERQREARLAVGRRQRWVPRIAGTTGRRPPRRHLLAGRPGGA